MSAIWDRTVEVLNGRAGMLATIAALTIVAPAVVSNLLNPNLGAAAGTQAVAMSFGDLLTAIGLGLVVAVLALVGVLAITAIASHPSIDTNRAFAIARDRLLLAIGLLLLLMVAMFGVFMVFTLALMLGGADLAAMSAAGRTGTGGAMATLPSGTAATIAIGGLALAVFLLWIAARLMLLYPVIVNEPAGTGSIRRAFALTRRLVWKILGVLILYGIVFVVCLAAISAVFGIVFRLVIGADNPWLVAFLVAVVSALVTAVFTVIQTVFATQLYVAARGAPPTAV